MGKRLFIATSLVITFTICAFAAEYYGSCGKCGWALDKSGRCTNGNCNGYGPRDDR